VVGDLPTYKLSQEKASNYLKAKVERLASSETCDSIPTLKRTLAKDGFGNEGDADEPVRSGGVISPAFGEWHLRENLMASSPVYQRRGVERLLMCYRIISAKRQRGI
jgi:hypothetical protein